jgi:hypothetical protein
MSDHGSTIRLHRHRARQREGKAVLLVEVCLAGHIALLIKSGWLKEWDDQDRAKIEEATAGLLAAALSAEESAG